MNKTPHWLKHSALTIAIASAGISSYPALAQIEGATLRGKVESTTESLAGKKVMAANRVQDTEAKLPPISEGRAEPLQNIARHPLIRLPAAGARMPDTP